MRGSPQSDLLERSDTSVECALCGSVFLGDSKHDYFCRACRAENEVYRFSGFAGGYLTGSEANRESKAS
jgi:hypothetical protein